MIERRPKLHEATITVETGGTYVNGEYVEGSKTALVISGRFDQTNSSRHVLKQNSNGDTLEVHGEYYTETHCPTEGQATHISIPGIGIERPIICWEDYQTHSVIYVGATTNANAAIRN